ncbi:MAG: ribonuclease PH [Smithellaceae bacterium]|nr:ribonuclease PH [Smithellaceae bacterium]MDD3259524.1 ribonuclease PH [Smithellaceae bacterium]MDD3849518.1 ribonuclease PH [Smithellaceae bacterium]HOG11953.1 ribonuclease PH [Smithellaceae bacterium]HOQ71501.1 ribonuclease PH [Smithellaceae bacterium]
MFKRSADRKWDELRPIAIANRYLKNVPGSVMVEFGNTKVLCAASLDEKTAPFLKNTGRGWLTAEYAMLPMSTSTRSARESARGKIGGRTHEIQRLIGRSLRAVTDLAAFGERTIYIDCDVIQADGGTRTASITGAFVALVELFKDMKERGIVREIPVADFVSAVSVGMLENQVLLDLEYEEDSRADVDMNFVMTGSGLFIEVQGTAEHAPFGKDRLDAMTALAVEGIGQIIARQKEITGDWRS